MALFDQTVPVELSDVSKIAAEHWDVQIVRLIKASQNHTFEGVRTRNGTEERCVVRVTPDPKSAFLGRIRREVEFVRYVASSGAVHHVCAPLPSNSGEFIVVDGDLVVVVSEWAQGAPVDFMSYRWMLDRDIVHSWGQWLAKFHAVSRKFSQERPETAKGIQRWDEMHHGILKGSALHPDDEAVMNSNDLQQYGVLHGDLNISNFFYVEDQHTLSVFDWDQTQQGWFLWDVAQSMFTVHMLAGAGSVVDGSLVPEANPVQFEDWMVGGYESVAGAGSVDRARLQRMIELRMHFYETFCRTAKAQGDLPKDMEHFINYVIAWFDKRRSV